MHAHEWQPDHTVPSLRVAYYVCACGAHGSRRRALRDDKGNSIPGETEITECRAPAKARDRAPTVKSIPGRNATGHRLPPSGGSRE